ncbi:MAG: lipase family protein [Betaproteobacteria bacterium]|nr:lipase family protein [Betaproteobacteria bacterium]
MKALSRGSRSLCALAALAFAIQTSQSGAFQANAAPMSAWTTQRFSKSDLPCLPLSKEKVFRIGQHSSPDNAYMMMAASYLAYSFWPGKRMRILSSWGFSNIQLFDDSASSTNGYWAEHTDFILIAFRGTQEPTDLLIDIAVKLERLEEGRENILVHSGFKRGAESVWKHVEGAARYAQERKKPLFVTGHSLGGAVALLNALRLEKSNFPVQALWTFGAPKVGNNLFFQSARALFEAKWHRINQETDPIPALPFTFEDENRLRHWSNRWGQFIPVLERFAENSQYDTAPLVYRETTSELTQRPITRRRFSEIGLGFLKHLPRSYVCDLAQEKLKL